MLTFHYCGGSETSIRLLPFECSVKVNVFCVISTVPLPLAIYFPFRLMSQFDYVFETPYDNQNLTAFTCTIDRPTNPTTPDQMMYVMNHFLYGVYNIGSTVIEVPQSGTANVTNGQSLQTQATQCTQTFGRQPNFIEVDFYEQGTCFQVVDSLNNVAYVSKSLGSATATSTSGKTTINNAAPSSSKSFSYLTLAGLTLGAFLFVTM